MRKTQSQPALATLTEAEREQLANWLRRDSYDVVLARVNQPRPEGFGLNISKKPLQTFYAKVALLDLINSRLPEDKKLTLAEFETLSSTTFNCGSESSQRVTDVHDSILNAAHDLATSGESTPAQLLALQRLADFPARAEIREQRLQLEIQKFAHKCAMDTFRQDITNQRLDLAQQSFAFRQKQHEDRQQARAQSNRNRNRNYNSKDSPAAANQRPGDHLGPYARTGEELSERVRRQQGVPKDEWDRRLARNRELYNQYYNPDGTLKIPDPRCTPASASQTPAQPRPGSPFISQPQPSTSKP
jgi:hypothetical protein